jgi:hypothetical protein
MFATWNLSETVALSEAVAAGESTPQHERLWTIADRLINPQHQTN